MFIVFEGIDGTGKATQLELLKNKMIEDGSSVSSFDFPSYDSFIGKEIGKLLSNRGEFDATNLPAKIMAMLFAVDRAQFRKRILKSLNDDQYTLSNRYSLSNIVFQSVRNNNDMSDWIQKLEHEILDLPKPDVYIVFNSNPNISEQLVLKKGIRSYTTKADVYESNRNLMEKANELYVKTLLSDAKKELIDMNKNNGQIKEIKEIHIEIKALLGLN